MSGQFPVFLGWTSTKQRIKCLVQELNTMHPSSLEPVTFDQVTYTLPEPLCSFTACLLWSMSIEQHLYQKCMGDLHKTCTLKVKVRGMRNWKLNPLSHCLTRIALKFMLGMWYFKTKIPLQPMLWCARCFITYSYNKHNFLNFVCVSEPPLFWKKIPALTDKRCFSITCINTILCGFNKKHWWK